MLGEEDRISDFNLLRVITACFECLILLLFLLLIVAEVRIAILIVKDLLV